MSAAPQTQNPAGGRGSELKHALVKAQSNGNAAAAFASTADPIDWEAAERFLSLLDEGADVFCFQTFTDRKPAPSPDPLRGHRTGTLAQCMPWLAQQYAMGAGVFVTVNETDGNGRRAENITRVRAVWHEDDSGTGKAPAIDLEPSFIVESSPNNFHRYWLVDGLTKEQHASVMAVMVDAHNSDKQAALICQVMRVPGFWHRKTDRHFQTRIWHESGAAPYSAEAILSAFAAKPGQSKPKNPQAPATGNLAGVPPMREGGAVVVLENRHGDVLKLTKALARSMVFDGMSEAAAWAALIAERDSGRWSREVGDGELRDALRGAVESYRSGKWQAPGASNEGTPQGQAPIVCSATELLGRTFSEVSWALYGILPEGVSILSGDPKIGKSWLVLQACIASATATPLWAGRDPEQQGDALYLSLEDNERRLQRRIAKLLPTVIDGRKVSTAPIDRLHYATDWPRGAAGVARIAEWLRAHPEARIVVIDTMSAFRDVDPGRKSAYAHDYALGESLKPLAREFRCAIVLVAHNRKADDSDPLAMVSGTQGLTGGVDNVLVLRRLRGSLDAGLYVDGRDIEEPQEIALKFNEGRWSSVGTVDDAKRSKERRAVLQALEDLGGSSKAKPLAEALGDKYGTIRKRLHDMVRAGELRNVDGVYSAAVTAAVTPPDMAQAA